MTIRDVLSQIARRWRIVVPCMVLATVNGIFLALITPPTYSTQALLYVASAGTSPADRMQNGEYIRTRITSYVQMVDTPAVLDGLRASLALDPRDRVAKDITADNPIDSAILDVHVYASSPERTQMVAARIGDVLNGLVADVESSSSGGGPSPVKISTVSAPRLPTAPDSPSKKLYGLAGLAVGAVLGMGVALLRELHERRRARRSSAEPSDRPRAGPDDEPSDRPPTGPDDAVGADSLPVLEPLNRKTHDVFP